MKIVLDASAGVDSVLAGSRGARVLDAMSGTELWAPSLVDSEVLSALARLERAGSVTGAEATRALDAWSWLECQRFPSELLLHDAWSRRGSPATHGWRAPVGNVDIQLIS